MSCPNTEYTNQNIGYDHGEYSELGYNDNTRYLENAHCDINIKIFCRFLDR